LRYTGGLLCNGNGFAALPVVYLNGFEQRPDLNRMSLAAIKQDESYTMRLPSNEPARFLTAVA
jgi:hypothetical protein